MKITSHNSKILSDYLINLKSVFVYKCILKLNYENDNTCIVVLNQDNINKEDIFNCLLKINREYNFNVMIGLGSIVNTLNEINESYDNAVDIIKYGDSSNENCIYNFNADMATNNSIYLPIDFQSKLTEFLYLGTKNSIEALIKEI